MRIMGRWIVALGVGVAGTGIALANPVSFADLARHAQFDAAKISPDGTHLAATTVLPDGERVLSLLDLATMHGKNVRTRAGESVLDFWWASPKYVVYNETQDLGGVDKPVANGELFSVEADGDSPTLIFGYQLGSTSAAARMRSTRVQDASAFFLARIDGDPTHVLITVVPWGASSWTHVERINVTNGHSVTVQTAPMPRAEFLADHHGHVRFAYGNDLNGKRVIYMRPVGGKWQLLQKASADRDAPIAFSADDASVWFTCPGKPSGFGVCKFDPATRRMTHVWRNPDVTASGLAQGLAANSIMGIDFTDGRPSISVLPGATAAVAALRKVMAAYPGEEARFVSGTDDGSKTIALVSADVDPGTFLLYDRATQTFRPLLRVAAWLQPDELGRVVPYTFKTRDGLTEQGYVTYPPGHTSGKNLPMVVFVHGGPYGIRDWWEYDPYVQALATRGYAVLQVNYRGSGGYGHAFEQAGWHQWGGKMQDDVTDATRWAIAQGIANPNRICIYGGSYGGYAALEGAVEEPNLYKCTIGYVGVYNLPAMQHRTDGAGTVFYNDFWARTMGNDMARLARHSPINQLASLKAKVMLIVGGRDRTVPPSQGKDMRAALLAHHIPVDWLYRSGEGHGFYNSANLAKLYRRVDAFIASAIGPGVTAAAPRSSAVAVH